MHCQLCSQMPTTFVSLIWTLILLLSAKAWAWDNGLGLTPPMGWNSWNHYYCEISETLIKEITDAMVSKGLKDAGYEYVNVDDCWQLSRDEDGKIQPDPETFPSGMKALGNYIHSKGMKFGLYSDAGLFTCQHRPGSLGYEELDAATYAEFGVDYLKYDNCYSEHTSFSLEQRYQAMHNALNATGRSIYFSMCEWGLEAPATWAAPIGNSWRTTDDISASWDSILEIMEINNQYYTYAGPGGWNDPDMLEVGNGALTPRQQRSHFVIWALMKAPLLLGMNVMRLEQETLDIITNKDIIAVNQDPLGIQGRRVKLNENGSQVWAGPLEGGDFAVVLFHPGSEAMLPELITAHWSEIGIEDDSTVMLVRDLWTHKVVGKMSDCFIGIVAAHDNIALRLTPVVGEE